MQKRLFYAVALVALQVILGGVNATPTVKVFSYDEALTEGIISKPRIYIQNLSTTESISHFYYCYYFTVENNLVPVLEDYYTPKSIPTLESLGNGNYRVTFTFLNVTLQPGQILPNTSGEVVGIRYGNWEPLNKTNDHSNNLASVFAPNPNIPVYLQDGTQIYGNLPPNPANPPQPPMVYAATGDFAVFSKEYTDIRNNVKITGGNSGSTNYLELGCDDTIYGSVFSKGSCLLRDRARVYGDVTSGQSVNKQNSSTIFIQGTERSLAQMELPELETPVVTIGSNSIDVPGSAAYTLYPGKYDVFHVNANAILTIMPGEYSFREFVLETNVNMLCNVGSTTRVDLNIRGRCSLGNGTNMTLPTGITTPLSVAIRSSQSDQLYIGTDATIVGLVYAPDAEVHVYSRTVVNGSLYGRQVVLEPQVTLCKPPTLLGLSHSEGAMAPPFDPMVFSYVAVVPEETATVTVNPTVGSGQTVTVNGKSPVTPVNLTGAETDITIEVSGSGACGITKYKMNVKRSEKYQIFVNPGSTCAPGSETGTTWECGYKTLQPALDAAAQKGMELWVKEGVYTPSTPINAVDPRSATLLIYPGVDIKGGFAGTETENKPEGERTIFTGDVLGDDDSCAVWPPDSSCDRYRDENLYHVVTAKGNQNAENIYLNGVTIERGNANGTGADCSGAGLNILSGKPSMEFVNIRYNSADCSGAGIYVAPAGGFSIFKNCLIDFNVSKSSDGGGMAYLSSEPLLIDASVFDKNTTSSTSDDHGGSALYFDKAEVRIINAVFARNTSHSNKGAVLNDGGSLYVLNCTFAFNTSTGAMSISNANGASTVIGNSILWNSEEKDEVNDTNFTIKYTCITNGFMGVGNLGDDPLFTNPTKPAGDDGRWGTFDDGLQLIKGSPCRDKSEYGNTPDEDFFTTPRDHNYYDDLGAYEYRVMFEFGQIVFGRLYSGNFIPVNDLTVITKIVHPINIYQYSKSKYQRVIRAYVERNKYTKNKTQIYGFLRVLDKNGVPLGKEIRVDLIKVADDREKIVFQSLAADYSWGKKILFVGEKYWHGVENPWVYCLWSTLDKPKLEWRVPNSQF